jgi:predicted nicotinamide N-methyase
MHAPDSPTFSFTTAIEEITIGSDVYRICHAADVEELFHRLMTLSPDHPDVTDERIPYWAEIWPSAIAMAEWLCEHPETVHGKQVLEIGCGLALPSIVASRLGARVMITDYVNEPLDLARYNMKLNGDGSAQFRLLDWRSFEDVAPVDVLLASDVAYERRMFDALKAAFHQLVKPEGIILISEPQRAFARAFFDGLKEDGFQVATIPLPVNRHAIQYNINVHTLRKETQSR